MDRWLDLLELTTRARMMARIRRLGYTTEQVECYLSGPVPYTIRDWIYESLAFLLSGPGTMLAIHHLLVALDWGTLTGGATTLGATMIYSVRISRRYHAALVSFEQAGLEGVETVWGLVYPGQDPYDRFSS